MREAAGCAATTIESIPAAVAVGSRDGLLSEAAAQSRAGAGLCLGTGELGAEATEIRAGWVLDVGMVACVDVGGLRPQEMHNFRHECANHYWVRQRRGRAKPMANTAMGIPPHIVSIRLGPLPPIARNPDPMRNVPRHQ